MLRTVACSTVWVLVLLLLAEAGGGEPQRNHELLRSVKKIDGMIDLHASLKKRRRSESPADYEMRLRALGLSPDRADTEECALYVERRLSSTEIAQLKEQGILVNPYTWVAPVPGKHELGFHLATVPYARLDVLRTDPRFRRAESVELTVQPQNNLSLGQINAVEVHDGTGVIARDGSGVNIAVADTGVDLTHDDIPEPVEAFDMTDGTDPDSWGTNVANTCSYHGTAVTATALGRGTLSDPNTANGGGPYKGSAPGANLYFYKVRDDSCDIVHADLIEAIDRAAEAGCDVFTTAFSGFTTSWMGAARSPSDRRCGGEWHGLLRVGWKPGGSGPPRFVGRAPRYDLGELPVHCSGSARVVRLYRGSAHPVIWIDDDSTDRQIELACTNLDPAESLIEMLAGDSVRETESKLYWLTPSIAAGQTKTYELTLENTATDGETPLVHCYHVFGRGSFEDPDVSYTVQAPALADSAIAVPRGTPTPSFGSARSRCRTPIAGSICTRSPTPPHSTS